MKDVLRHLLDAEESGRQAALGKELAASQVLRNAHEEAERVAQQWQERAHSEIIELEQKAREDLASQHEELKKQTNMRMEQLSQLFQQKSQAAIKASVTLLLGE